MKDIKLYTWHSCPFCIRAKQLLKNGGYEFEEIDIEDTPQVKRDLTAKYGQHTVPYVFIGDDLIGGCAELTEIMNNGEFETLIQD